MILITSANYVNYGLASEFGNIPPCMLPVQNKRLYEHQYNLIEKLQSKLDHREDVYLSLPSTYDVPKFDRIKLSSLGISTITIEPEVSLLTSIYAAINMINSKDEPIRILLGDTLFSDLPASLDVYLSFLC